jgi:AMMECR1 domain-containing protein
LPTQATVGEEITANALAAALRDPRFPPVSKEELTDLTISVDVLSTPEKVTDIESLDARKYGVIVASGWRRGLLLPDLAGVESVEEQIAIAREKAGIAAGEKIDLYRFTVTRHV